MDVEHVLGWIVLGAAAWAALVRWIVKPMWEAMKAKVRWDNATPVLLGIAEQFKPNDGETLHDRITQLEANITRIERNQQSVCEKIDALANRFDVHIMQIQPGGKRSTDP